MRNQTANRLDVAAALDGQGGQHAAGEALRRIEAQFRRLTETIPQVVGPLLDDSNWKWAGPQRHTYTGQAEQDSRGHGWNVAPVASAADSRRGPRGCRPTTTPEKVLLLTGYAENAVPNHGHLAPGMHG